MHSQSESCVVADHPKLSMMDIAEAVGKTVNSVRGKLLSMGLKAEQREKKATKSDPYEGVEDMGPKKIGTYI